MKLINNIILTIYNDLISGKAQLAASDGKILKSLAKKFSAIHSVVVKQNNTGKIPKEQLVMKLEDIYLHEFIQTGFADRFLSLINEYRISKQWSIIGSPPRNGKSWCIRHIKKNCGTLKDYSGHTKVPVIAIQSPESNSTADLISSLYRYFGNQPKVNSTMRKNWLVENIPRFGVEQIIIDDAHEMNLIHYKFIKWLTDTIMMESDHNISIVFS